jgi:hypothetical protein
MATAAAAQWAAEAMAIMSARAGWLRGGQAAREHALDRIAVDGLALSPGRVAHGAVSDAIDITQRACRVLVHEGDSVLGEEALLGAGQLEPIGDVLGDVFSAGVVDGEAMMDAREERAVAPSPSLELVFEFRESDQHEREQGAVVPLVIEEDM